MYSSDLKQMNLINRDDVRKIALLRCRAKQYPHDLDAYYSRKKVCLPKQDISTTCPICLETYVRTAITNCGHSFCERCILESTLRKPICPICRTNLKNSPLKYSSLLDQVITEKLTLPEQEKHKILSEEHEQWNKSRRIQSISEGDLLDVLDTENIWCVAQVLNIREIGSKKVILIHYLGWNKIYDEIISINSPRLAPKGFFTDRKDLPHYQINGQTDVTYSYVVVDNGEQTDRQFTHFESLLHQLISQRLQYNMENIDNENQRQPDNEPALNQSQQNIPPE